MGLIFRCFTAFTGFNGFTGFTGFTGKRCGRLKELHITHGTCLFHWWHVDQDSAERNCGHSQTVIRLGSVGRTISTASQWLGAQWGHTFARVERMSIAISKGNLYCDCQVALVLEHRLLKNTSVAKSVVLTLFSKKAM